jgi:hypothetical protein
MAEHHKDPPKLEIDWLKTLAGALAAVTTAVLLSTLGAVGTLIGAALGSVAATIGSALYTQGLARSRNAVLKAQETAMLKVGIAQAEVRRAARREGAEQEAHLELADERLGEAQKELEPEPGAAPTTWRQRAAALSWRRIALVTAGTFAAVVLAITAFEALSGHSVSSYTGGSDKDQGTTIGGVTGNSGTGKPAKPSRPSHFESPTGTPSETPSDQPSEVPSETPTQTQTPTPTPEPTDTPTTSPTPTDTPSPTDTSSPTAGP